MALNDIPESLEQRALIEWTEAQKAAWPEIGLIYAIPNGGKRRRIEAAIMKAEGVKAGFPDLGLPVPRFPYHGLYIEMKRRDGEMRDNQERWAEDLVAQGYQHRVAYGADEAIEAIRAYMLLPRWPKREVLMAALKASGQKDLLRNLESV